MKNFLPLVFLFAACHGSCTAKTAAQKESGGMCWANNNDNGAICLVVRDGETEVKVCNIEGTLTFDSTGCRGLGWLDTRVRYENPNQ